MEFIRRLLILSCSQRKRSDQGLLAAVDRYDGPAFRVLRRFLREHSESVEQLDVYVLSAAYGLIPSSHLVTDYDRVMTPQRASELQEEALAAFSNLVRTNYTDICLAMSKRYLMVFEGWLDSVPTGTHVSIIAEAQGVILKRLKVWLWGGDVDNAQAGDLAARSCGVAGLRGIELRLTPEQVIQQAQMALGEEGGGACFLRDWYVLVGDQRVPPKWLVSKLTGLPVGQFTSSEARRVLRQLGIEVNRLTTKDV